MVRNQFLYFLYAIFLFGCAQNNAEPEFDKEIYLIGITNNGYNIYALNLDTEEIKLISRLNLPESLTITNLSSNRWSYPYIDNAEKSFVNRTIDDNGQHYFTKFNYENGEIIEHIELPPPFSEQSIFYDFKTNTVFTNNEGRLSTLDVSSNSINSYLLVDHYQCYWQEEYFINRSQSEITIYCDNSFSYFDIETQYLRQIEYPRFQTSLSYTNYYSFSYSDIDKSLYGIGSTYEYIQDDNGNYIDVNEDLYIVKFQLKDNYVGVYENLISINYSGKSDGYYDNIHKKYFVKDEELIYIIDDNLETEKVIEIRSNLYLIKQ